MLSSSDPNPTIHSIPRDLKDRTSNWVPRCLQKVKTTPSNSHGVGWKEAPLFKFQCSTSQNIKSGNCDEDTVHQKFAMPNQRAQATGRLLHLPPTNLTHTHTHTKTNNTYSRWLESREDKEERERERVPSLESVTPRTDTQRQSWSSKIKTAAPRGLNRPILPILVSWSTPRSTVMLLNAANPCPHWLVDAPTPTLQLLLPQKSTSLLPRDSRPEEPGPAFNPKQSPYTHATQICCEQNKTRVSCNRCPPPAIRFKDSHSIMHCYFIPPPRSLRFSLQLSSPETRGCCDLLQASN